MDIFLDTSFIIPLLIETDRSRSSGTFFATASGSCAASMSIYEECFFVGLRLIADSEYGITSTKDLKRHIQANGYGFADEFIRNLNRFFGMITILPDTENLGLIEKTAKECSLLPNDALIVATCREHAIGKLATYDRDFSRVPGLECLPSGN
ncbi:MAG: PIN domain-containing protein [Methanoregulaceae archaeon]